jgi:hypothetical protein
MFKECNDKYTGIIEAKGLATPTVQEATVIPVPQVTAEEQLSRETEEYLASLLPPAKRPDPESDESTEPDDGENPEEDEE